MKKRIFALLLALVLVCSLCTSAFAFNPETRNSVVMVMLAFQDTDGTIYGFGWGTGFFVGKLGENPKYIVTDHHVIESFIDYGSGELVDVPVDGGYISGRAKIFIYYSSNDYEEGYLVAYDDIKDLAVLKLAQPTSKRVALAITEPTDSMVGSNIYCLGFPGLAENIFYDATTQWGTGDITVTKGVISRLLRTQGTGVANVQIDAETKSGNSGGPIVTEDNVVIAVHKGTVSNDSGAVRYATSVEELIPILNQYGVPYTDGAALPQTETQDFTPPETEPAQPASGGFPLWAIIALAAVVLIAIAVVLIVTLGKKKAAPAPAPQPAPQYQPQPQRPQQPQRKAGVRSLSSQHRGNVIQVGQQPILIGRGTDCAVVFQNNTPGVSGHHCSLSFDAAANVFLLTDLQSTYGTFLANGQKLTPNMPYRLRAGDQFYLGEPQNKLQLMQE